jgi:ferric-chelate reductase
MRGLTLCIALLHVLTSFSFCFTRFQRFRTLVNSCENVYDLTIRETSFATSRLVQQHYLTGTIGATAFGALFLFSLRPVRTHAFEFFLILHICLVAVFLVCSYLHQPQCVSDLVGLDKPLTASHRLSLYIWLAIGFWGFDRVCRVLRLVFVNTRTSTPVKAVVERVSSDAVRITLPNRHIDWSAGQHAFLSLPGISGLPFESHPFTIASIREPTVDRDRNHPLVFIIRAMDGFTRHLYNYAVTHPSKPVTVLVDGPYGRPPPVNSFSSVILLAGGSGVSYTLSLLLDIVSSVRRRESPVRRILFVWSVKRRGRSMSHIRYYPWFNVPPFSLDDIKWAYRDLKTALKTLPPNLSIDIRIHVTRTTAPVYRAGYDNDAMDEKDFSLHPVVSRPTKGATHKVVPVSPAGNLQVCLGRPDLLALVREEVESAQGPVSVNGEHYSVLLPLS